MADRRYHIKAALLLAVVCAAGAAAYRAPWRRLGAELAGALRGRKTVFVRVVHEVVGPAWPGWWTGEAWLWEEPRRPDVIIIREQPAPAQPQREAPVATVAPRVYAAPPPPRPVRRGAEPGRALRGAAAAPGALLQP